MTKQDKGEHKIKCVVWDLDNTIWAGILAEDERVILKKNVLEVIATLDKRGILQSIASKNNEAQAITKLKELCLYEYFIYPEIHWNSKSQSLKNIAEAINIDVKTLAFVDDQAFERDEVKFSIPQVLCVDATDILSIPDMPEMNPRFVTDESRVRRKLYQNDIIRDKIEEKFEGPDQEFLASLEMKLTISTAGEEDLKRAEELTIRTHQLNTTGYTYSYEELDGFRRSDNHLLLVADLEDKYGPYGKIGLCLVEVGAEAWTIKLLLMSCRVMSRGAGGALITCLRQKSKEMGIKLRAEFLHTEVNRMMHISYRFAGFEEKEQTGNLTILENDLDDIPELPDYIEVNRLF